MSREKLIKQLRKNNPRLSSAEVDKVINIFCNNIKVALKKKNKVELRGFGTFFSKKIKEKHSARNPRTGELIYVPEKNKIRFKVSKNLNKNIND